MNEPPWWRAATLAERAAADGAPPAWWEHFEATLAPGTRSTIRDRDDDADADVARGALRLVAPFARRAHRTLRAHPSATNPAARSLALALAEELAELSRPAVVLELVAARAAGGWREDEVQRESAARLRELGGAEDARVLLEAHPSLARMLVERTRMALEAGRELLDRVAAEQPRVRDELLGGENPGAVAAIALAGDSHAGGRRVARISFQSGARAVLKPRSLVADRAFADLLGALNELGFEPAFQPLATLETGSDHGWQAWAQPASCSSSAELERYFRRLGGQLAVLHALRATDMHQENVLACGEHPALVDLETVLHPRLGGERAGVVDPLIAETGLDCVLRVGLLPRADVAFGVDISGLGRDPEGDHEADQLAWVGEGADARLVARRLRLEPGDNAPRLGASPIRPHEYLHALATGFSDAYVRLAAHRERLLAPGGALAAFAGVTTRVVLRPTKVYVDLLRRQSLDLSGLDDGRARDEALDIVWRGAGRRPELRIAAPAERHDLWLGDVPRFTTTSGSCDGAHHALGRLPAMLAPQRAPGPDVVRRLTDRDLERQLSFLRGSVLAAASGADGAAVEAHSIQASSAREVAERLEILALCQQDLAGWLAPVVRPPAGARVLRPIGPDLRHGQAGIVLFLDLLGRHGPQALGEAASRRLAALLAEGAELTTEQRGGLLLALGGRDDVLGRTELVRALSAPTVAEDPDGLANFVLGLSAAAAAARDADLRARLEDAATALAGAGGSPTVMAALALAAAAARLGDDGGRLAAAARTSAEAVDPSRASLARVAALTATAPGAPAALLRDLGEAVRRLSPDGVAPASAVPTARRFTAPVILRAAAAALGGSDGAHALALAEPLVAALSTQRSRFEGGVETPILDGGLAGIGLGWLALDGNRYAGRALVAAWASRQDARQAVRRGSSSAGL